MCKINREMREAKKFVLLLLSIFLLSVVIRLTYTRLKGSRMMTRRRLSSYWNCRSTQIHSMSKHIRRYSVVDMLKWRIKHWLKWDQPVLCASTNMKTWMNWRMVKIPNLFTVVPRNMFWIIKLLPYRLMNWEVFLSDVQFFHPFWCTKKKFFWNT